MGSFFGPDSGRDLSIFIEIVQLWYIAIYIKLTLYQSDVILLEAW